MSAAKKKGQSGGTGLSKKSTTEAESVRSAKPPVKGNEILTAALSHAERGWRVFPILAVTANNGCECGDLNCDRPGKHPAIKGWPEEATTDEAKIREWFETRPDRGIGIATGEGSGLTVLDVDGPEGVAALGALQKGNAMPATPCASSRPDHYHYFFRYQKGIGSTASKLGAHLDTRSDGGYVVAVPSRHASGGQYKWNTPPNKVDLAPWPEFLKGKASEKKKAGRPPKESFNPSDPRQVAELTDALGHVDSNDEERWYQTCLILGRAFHQSDPGFAFCRAWAAGSRKFNAKKTKELYYTGSKAVRGGELKTTASIFAWAIEAGWVRPDPAATEEREFNVYANPFNERTMVDEMAVAAAAAPDVFVMGVRLIHVVRYGVTAAHQKVIERDALGWVLAEHSVNTLATALGPVAAYWAYRKGHPPERTAFERAALHTFVDCKAFLKLKQLRAFLPHPTLRADGTMIEAEGYDAASRLYLTAAMPALKVAADLTPKAARAAYERLLEPFSEFPWANPIDRAVFAAALFTVGLRHLFDVAPLFAFSSPKHGTGKTKLAECISRLWYGVTLSKTQWTPNPEEMEKRIAAFLRAGDRIVCLDNVKEGHRLEDATLNMVLTSERNTFRILGETESIELTNEATWFATGNGLQIAGDISRRALMCYIDAKVQDPGARRFTHEALPEYVLEQRVALLGDALSIVASWIAAGRPAKPAPREYGSFTDWYAMMRGVLLWVGEEDLAEAIDNATEDDMESVALGAFADALRDRLPAPLIDGNGKDDLNQAKTAMQIVKMMDEETGKALRTGFYECVPRGYEPNNRTLGELLRRCENKVFVSSEDVPKGGPQPNFAIVKRQNATRNGFLWGWEKRPLLEK